MEGLKDESFMRRVQNNIRLVNEDQDIEDMPSGPVYIFPTLQFPVIKFNEDEVCFHSLLKQMADPVNNFGHLKMATGYLNLQKEFRKVLN